MSEWDQKISWQEVFMTSGSSGACKLKKASISPPGEHVQEQREGGGFQLKKVSLEGSLAATANFGAIWPKPTSLSASITEKEDVQKSFPNLPRYAYYQHSLAKDGYGNFSVLRRLIQFQEIKQPKDAHESRALRTAAWVIQLPFLSWKPQAAAPA